MDDEKQLLRYMSYLQLGFHHDVYADDLYPEFLQHISADSICDTLYQLGSAVQDVSGTFLRRDKYVSLLLKLRGKTLQT